MTSHQFPEYLIHRTVGYDLLRRLLIEEPTPALLNFLQQQDLATLFPAIADANFSSALERVQHALAGEPFITGDSAFENLHWDFTRLFIGPETPPAPPWESVYVSRDKLLFQRCTQEVKQVYQSCGLTMSDDDGEAPDHIGFELDFLYQQSQSVAEALHSGASLQSVMLSLLRQRDFLQQHTLAFCDAFSHNVKTHAETDFYCGIAQLLPVFLTHDAQQLNQVVGMETVQATS